MPPNPLAGATGAAEVNKARWIMLAAAIYVSVAALVYAFRHPEMTETQRFLHLIDAVLWED